MGENRIVVLPAELVEKIDVNRGELSRGEFLNTLLSHVLQEGPAKNNNPYVTSQDMEAFRQDVRTLLKSFLDFFVTYGLELGSSLKKEGLDVLEQRIKDVTEGPHKASKLNPR